MFRLKSKWLIDIEILYIPEVDYSNCASSEAAMAENGLKLKIEELVDR